MTPDNGFRPNGSPQPIDLSPEEQVVLLMCLVEFNGKRDTFLTFLDGLPDHDDRKAEQSLIRRLAARDQHENIRENYMIDSITSQLMNMETTDLLRVWNYCELLWEASGEDEQDD